MRKPILILATVSLILSAHALSAQDQPPQPPPQPPQPVQVVAGVLQLSDTQLASWLDILKTRQQALDPLLEQRRTNEQAIGKALQSATPDALTIGQLVIQQKSIETQIGSVNSQSAGQFEQLLTADQKTRLQQIREAAHACPIVPAFAATGLL